MKQYVIDELRDEDYRKVKAWLDEHCRAAGISGVYWLTLPESVLTDLQRSHTDCKPYYLGLELDENALSCGLLVRATGNIRCHCIGYATRDQLIWLIETIDAMTASIGVIV
ncbi:hypothetical protein JCM14469_24370 [Desulfatiferula olefinivorans]